MKKSAIGWVFLIIPMFFFIGVSHSQTYSFRNFSVEDGLPFINVSAISQDDKGFLWCGGYAGISRFDGRSFINFGRKDGLSNSSVKAILEDSLHRIWIGTIEGLSCFYEHRFVQLPFLNRLRNKAINCLLYSKGSLWVGTSEGLFHIKGNELNQFTSLGNVDVSAISEIGDEILLSVKNIIYSLDPHQNRSTPKFEIAPKARISSISIVNNKILIGSSLGLYEYNSGRISRIKEIPVNTMLKGDRNRIWLGGPKGLHLLENETLREIVLPGGLNANIINALFKDRERNLWIGTYSGLYRLSNMAFEVIAPEIIGESFVFPIVRDQAKNIWIGTAHGLFNMKGSSPLLYKDKNLQGNFIYSLLPVAGGMWIGTTSGLAWMEGGNIKKTYRKGILPSDSVVVLYADHLDQIWAGCPGGITLINRKGIYSYNPEPDNPHYMVTSVLENDDEIWFGSYQGNLSALKNGKFRNLGKELGLGSHAFMALLAYGKYRIIGTFDGVYIWDGKNMILIDENRGLSSNLVYSLCFDKENNLWVGTNQGINKVDWNLFLNSGEIKISSYSREDGFKGVECNTNSFFPDDDGSLWVGTVGGLIHFNPSELNPMVRPKISLSRIKVNEWDTLITSGASLNYSLNSVAFYFTGICLSRPDKVKYRFMLKGFDKKWSESGSVNQARYPNLPPGNYTFLADCSNNEGAWTNSPASFSFTVLSPFWLTWWFSMLMVLLIAGMVYFLVRVRIKNIRKKERAEMTHRLSLMDYQLQALRAQMNPHFIFNSMNSIQNFILDENVENANKYLNKFSRLIRLILQNAEKSTLTIREEVECLRLYLELEKMRFGPRLEYEILLSEDLDEDLIEIPSLIIQPYVENAILHGIMPRKEGGKVEISLFLKDHFLNCSIRDNGIGRERSAFLKNRSSSHKSMGMKITSDRLKMLNELYYSQLSVTISDLPQGTQVDILIPLNQTEYAG